MSGRNGWTALGAALTALFDTAVTLAPFRTQEPSRRAPCRARRCAPTPAFVALPPFSRRPWMKSWSRRDGHWPRDRQEWGAQRRCRHL